MWDSCFNFFVTAITSVASSEGRQRPRSAASGVLMVPRVLGRLSASTSRVVRYKDRQHGTVCQHRCVDRTWCCVPSCVNWRRTSSSVTGPPTVDRRRRDCLQRVRRRL